MPDSMGYSKIEPYNVYSNIGLPNSRYKKKIKQSNLTLKITRENAKPKVSTRK